MDRAKSNEARSPIIGAALGVAAGLASSVLLAALAALLLQKQVLGFESIAVVNPIIKSLGALIAALIGARRFQRARFLVGAGLGLLYIAVATLVFSLLSGGFSLSVSTLGDALMCAFAGMIGGVMLSLSTEK